ncbi:HAD family hydrolase [Glaciecola siphonariae]|uniref:HAD family hydrolase n=1 Tax=Glaciecola siphonariae TaxID=521012 RepID=A0ABV9LWX2_9ALTE
MFCFTRVKGIIFDLDDTLVHAKLDFAAMKQEIACPHDDDILEYINTLAPEKREEATKLVLMHELRDAENSRLIAGAKDFIERAIEAGIPLAIVTRNCRRATQRKLELNAIPIEHVLTREDALPKPHPEALLKISNDWQIPEARIAYIGDYKYDIEAAHNAGMQAWLFEYCSKNTQYEKALRFIPAPLAQ